MSRTYRTDIRGRKHKRKSLPRLVVWDDFRFIRYQFHQWFYHDKPTIRRQLNKSHRMRNKQYFRRFGEALVYFKSRGRESW